MDTFDLQILRELQQNAKTTVKELSEKINLSPTPVFERIKKLETSGYITGYFTKLNADKLDYKLTVMCSVTLRHHNSEMIDKFHREVIVFDEVRECFHLAGIYDYLLKVIVKDIDEYQTFVSKKLASLENIGNVQSSFVMKSLKSEFGIKI